MKYARSCAHFGHVADVLSTFFHASSPPRTSSTVFLACSTRCFTPLVTSYAYGHDAHRRRTPPTTTPEAAAAADDEEARETSARRAAAAASSRSRERSVPHVGQNVSMTARAKSDDEENARAHDDDDS